MEKSIIYSLQGFSKLKRHERILKLLKMSLINKKEAQYFLQSKKLPFSLAEKFIENLIGYYPIPLGVAVNSRIDKKDYIIPMAVEETSVIAAASKTAKWIRETGEIMTQTLGNQAIGQIQLGKIKDFNEIKNKIEKQKHRLIQDINKDIASNMVKRGGGVKEIMVRRVSRDDGNEMAVIHVMVETCDAMGANVINQICEYLKSPIEMITQETVNLCILSNLTDRKLTQAKIVISDIDPKLGRAIEEASFFAQKDMYRAATNNKGVLNGMDPVVIATGNDWRAVEAGVHAYAAYQGKYSSISKWFMRGNQLIGVLEAPINVGIVGGMTRLHPTARLCLKILNVKDAQELSRVIAAVGLVQNLGALRALVTEGICKGHMRLHIANLCMEAGANFSEINVIKKELEKKLSSNERISVSDARNILDKIRK